MRNERNKEREAEIFTKSTKMLAENTFEQPKTLNLYEKKLRTKNSIK
jgi:hypothetical protein